jgi:hypothetical protein
MNVLKMSVLKPILFCSSFGLISVAALVTGEIAQAADRQPKLNPQTLRSTQISWDFKPPNRNAPSSTAGGASRSGACVSAEPPLTLLLPSKTFGLTAAARPTFLLYLPKTTAQSAQFVLKDSNNRNVYQTMIELPSRHGIVRLSLPEQAPALKVGQDYQWYFAVVCDPDDRSEDVIAQGWIQHTLPNANLVNALKRATASEQVALYAQSSYWYDSVAMLAALRQANPKDAKLNADWLRLLKAVGLTQVADQPLLGSPLQASQPLPNRPIGNGTR